MCSWQALHDALVPAGHSACVHACLVGMLAGLHIADHQNWLNPNPNMADHQSWLIPGPNLSDYRAQLRSQPRAGAEGPAAAPGTITAGLCLHEAVRPPGQLRSHPHPEPKAPTLEPEDREQEDWQQALGAAHLVGACLDLPQSQLYPKPSTLNPKPKHLSRRTGSGRWCGAWSTSTGRSRGRPATGCPAGSPWARGTSASCACPPRRPSCSTPGVWFRVWGLGFVVPGVGTLGSGTSASCACPQGGHPAHLPVHGSGFGV